MTSAIMKQREYSQYSPIMFQESTFSKIICVSYQHLSHKGRKLKIVCGEKDPTPAWDMVNT